MTQPPDNVLFFTFTDPSATYRAFSEVKAVPEDYQPQAGTTTLTGGAIGALVGILGGPVGVLFGWGLGALIEATADTETAEDAHDALTVLSKNVDDGANLLMVEATAFSPAAADDLAGRLGGTVVAVPVEQVEEEVASAQKAAEEAVRQARHDHRKQRRHEFREKMDTLFSRGLPA
ncbi:histidine kinase [Streptomyces sp. NPDC058373]|uniref:histidine kinase n=1 Tax=Streptomyces sp. NPDC058373 TaxID=3346465 RepID=UPI0036669FCC